MEKLLKKPAGNSLFRKIIDTAKLRGKSNRPDQLPENENLQDVLVASLHAASSPASNPHGVTNDGHIKSLHARQPRSREGVLSIKGLKKSYKGRKVVRGVN